MMTVKHITLSGEEFVYPTTHVNFTPNSNTLWRYEEDGRAHPFDEGSVFVMNEHGKTVARYTLSTNEIHMPAA